MTNREKYAKEILDIACNRSLIALVNGKLVSCNRTPCSECDFQGLNCKEEAKEWANSEYVEPTVDWSKVAVDTPILVKDFKDGTWYRRYFAKYENKKVFTWGGGRTSWNTDGNVSSWAFAKLADSE